MFLLYTAELFSFGKQVAVVTSPGERETVTESLNRDLNRACIWCDLPGMKLNAIKTRTMIVSRSSTIHPESSPLTLDGTVLLKEPADLDILEVTFDAKMTFGKHNSFCFHSCRSEAWNHEKFLASIS